MNLLLQVLAVLSLLIGAAIGITFVGLVIYHSVLKWKEDQDIWCRRRAQWKEWEKDTHLDGHLDL